MDKRLDLIENLVVMELLKGHKHHLHYPESELVDALSLPFGDVCQAFENLKAESRIRPILAHLHKGVISSADKTIVGYRVDLRHPKNKPLVEQHSKNLARKTKPPIPTKTIF